jgi:hypothetical protein
MKDDFMDRIDDILNPPNEEGNTGFPATLSAQELPSNIKVLLERFLSAYEANNCIDNRASEKLLEDTAISVLLEIAERVKSVSLESHILRLGGEIISASYTLEGRLTVYKLPPNIIEPLKTEIKIRLYNPMVHVIFEGDTLKVLEESD